MKQGSIGNMLNQYAISQNDLNPKSYEALAYQELKEGKRIRFRLTAFGYNGEITHWHIRHIKSGELFIVLA